MVNVDKAVTARMKIEGNVFEILVDCEKALEFRKGKSVGLDDVLASDMIFKDVKKGEKASEHLMSKYFGTTDHREIAIKIIKKGEVQLTTEYREKEREEKRKQIINIIHRNAVDPKTGLPHPPLRIENALTEAKVKIDENKTAEDQVQDIIKELRSVLPIRFETKEVAVKIPAKYAGSSYSALKQYGKLLKDEWQNDGSLVAVVELPGGLLDEFFDKLNGLTHGEVETKIIGAK